MAEPNRTPEGSDSTAPERDPDARTDGTATAVPATSRREARAADADRDEEPTRRTEPTLDERTEPGRDERVAPVRGERTERIETAEGDRTERIDPARDERTGRERTAEPARTTAAHGEPAPAAVPEAPAQQPVVAPAADDAPPAPHKGSNRLAGTAWVLLAAGLFEVLYFAVLALLTLLLASPSAVGPQLAVYARTPLTWFPVLVFFVLFELTVLIFNRRGRFWYVVASLIVGVVVYFLTALFIDVSSGGSLADRNTVAQIFLTPPIVLVGLVAREVMLWTGFAVGARGKRVRLRNRAARDAYRQELAERDDRTA